MGIVIVLLVMISFASAAISFTITMTSIFKWLRELVSPIHHKIEELIHCPWCLSHYITLVGLIMVFSKTMFLPIHPVLHFILNWFAMQAIIGLLHYVFLRAYEPVGKLMMVREIEKKRAQNASGS